MQPTPGTPGQGSRDLLDDYVRPPQSGGSGRRRRFVAAVGIAAILTVTLLLASGTGLNRSGDSSKPPALTDQQPQAPWDGKDSRRLPVKVTPDVGLQDGQMVEVSGSGFPARASIAAVICTIAAGSRGVDACDLGTSSYMAGTTTITDSDGQFTIAYPMRRFIQVDGETVDCLAGNVDPARYRAAVAEHGPGTKITTEGAFSCVIAAGMINNYDVSGGALVAMAGETFMPFDVDAPETSTTSTASTATPVPATEPPTTTRSSRPPAPTTSVAPPETSTTIPPDTSTTTVTSVDPADTTTTDP